MRTTIVLTRAREDHVVAREGRIDLGERHTMRTVRVPEAVMWMADIPEEHSSEERRKAGEYADKEGWDLVAYDADHFTAEEAFRHAKSMALAHR